MLSAGFEPTIQELEKTVHALDRSAIVIGSFGYISLKDNNMTHKPSIVKLKTKLRGF
jgi:hypothetical protein